MRSLWVVAHEPGGTTPGRVAWSRKFPSVESRHRARVGVDAKRDVQDEDDFAAAFRIALAEHQRAATSLVPVLWPNQAHMSPMAFAEYAYGYVVVLPSILRATPVSRAG